jgi:hypothetical protein
MESATTIAVGLCPFAEREWHRDDCACCKRIKAALVEAREDGAKYLADRWRAFEDGLLDPKQIREVAP